MKFITEDDLRRRYQEAPFMEYPYQEGSRLTPGGRQFLLDRGVKIGEKQSTILKPKHCTPIKPEESCKIEADTQTKLALEKVRASFLQVGVDLLEHDILSAQEIFAMEQYLAQLIKGEELTTKLDDQPCTGLHADNFSENMGICFEINSFHAQTQVGLKIVKLHYLRCLLQEQEAQLTGVCKEGVNCLINRLSQTICRGLGGTVCQRKQ